jgi:hypothetical protein
VNLAIGCLKEQWKGDLSAACTHRELACVSFICTYAACPVATKCIQHEARCLLCCFVFWGQVRLLQAYEQLQAALNLGRPVQSHRLDKHDEAHSSSFSEDHMHGAFDQFAGPDGTVQVSQVGRILAMLNIPLSPVQLQAATAQLDPSATGFVARNDFLAWAKG